MRSGDKHRDRDPGHEHHRGGYPADRVRPANGAASAPATVPWRVPLRALRLRPGKNESTGRNGPGFRLSGP